MPFGFADQLQALELPLLDQAGVVGLHTGGDSQREQRFGIPRVGLKPATGEFFCPQVGGGKRGAARRVRFDGGSAEQPLVVEKEFGGQHAQAVKLLEQVAGSLRGASQRIVRMRLLPVRKLRARFSELQLVEQPEAGVELRRVRGARRDRRANQRGPEC